MKRGGNSQLKAALSALCHSLPGSGWNPETFRKAKFNRPEATSEFWKLLYCVLKLTCPKKGHSSTLTDENQSLDIQATYVKYELRNQGYGRLAFYKLPCDGTEGSRELLLAFSWLLRKVNIFEKLLDINRVRFGDEITCCMCLPELFLKENGDFGDGLKKEMDVRYLQWLNGKLQYCWRNLYAMQQEKCAILFKIHSLTQGCHVDPNINHLSFMEADLVRQPEKFAKLLPLLSSENFHLEAYLEWKQLEPVYWQWMDSVLLYGYENGQSISEENNTNTFFPFGFCHWSNSLKKDIETTSNYLAEIKIQLEGLMAVKKSEWHKQFAEIEKRLNEKELYLTGKKIKQEAEKQKENLKQNFQAREMHGPFRLVFNDRIEVRKDFNNKDPKMLLVTELITQLLKAEADLDTEFQNLREKGRCWLADAVDQFEGIICIPPTRVHVHHEQCWCQPLLTRRATASETKPLGIDASARESPDLSFVRPSHLHKVTLGLSGHPCLTGGGGLDSEEMCLEWRALIQLEMWEDALEDWCGCQREVLATLEHCFRNQEELRLRWLQTQK
ncbi:tubulin epsilon and delta complex protein 1 [Pelodytes ibericus]